MLNLSVVALLMPPLARYNTLGLTSLSRRCNYDDKYETYRDLDNGEKGLVVNAADVVCLLDVVKIVLLAVREGCCLVW